MIINVISGDCCWSLITGIVSIIISSKQCMFQSSFLLLKCYGKLCTHSSDIKTFAITATYEILCGILKRLLAINDRWDFIIEIQSGEIGYDLGKCLWFLSVITVKQKPLVWYICIGKQMRNRTTVKYNSFTFNSVIPQLTCGYYIWVTLLEAAFVMN